MLSSSLTIGDIISVKAWYGTIDVKVVIQFGALYLVSEYGDVKFPVSLLSHTSEELTALSRWRYKGKAQHFEGFTDYEEVGKEPKQDLQRKFLTDGK